MPELSYGQITVPHDVELRSGTVTHTETFTAATPGLACKMAKLMHPGAEVLRVTRTWTPLDACIICGTIIFDGDGHRKRRGSMRCWECS